MDSQHTETPWWYQEKSDSYTHILRSGENRFVCQFGSEATARRVLACVNAFHDLAGRTIATEQIHEALFWEAHRFMEWVAWQQCTCADIVGDGPCMSCQACGVITALKVQGPES